MAMVNCRLFCTLLLALSACGDGSGGGANGDGDESADGSQGQVTERWEAFCIATFTEDYQVIDPFGDPVLDVAKGERFLLEEYPAIFPERATILYLGNGGPVDFEIEVAEGAPFPFTSSCALGAGKSAVGVFADVTVYANASLSDEACTLEAGSVTSNARLNYETVSDLDDDRYVFRFDFAGLEALCGVADGYVEAARVQAGSTEYVGLPLATLLEP
jgi:hypothetical protein